MFSDTYNFCSTLKAKDCVPHPYKTMGEISIIYIICISFGKVEGMTLLNGVTSTFRI
jgi:hypothetical protein